MIDLIELKKLPNEEKRRIIDELEESMEGEEAKRDTLDADYEDKLHQLLQERLEAYNKGESKSYTWEEVKDRLKMVKVKMHTLSNG